MMGLRTWLRWVKLGSEEQIRIMIEANELPAIEPTALQRQQYAELSCESLLLTKLGHAMEEFEAAQQRLSEASEDRRLAVKHALRHGKSLRELADLMGISHSRVQQIAKDR